MGRRSNIVTIRLTDRELDFVREHIDDVYNFTVSDAVRSFVVAAMISAEDGLVKDKSDRKD